MTNIRIIKRYANRKLYDTERSCYVTLEDLAVLVREGEEVKIIDNKSAEDLTTVTLAQIIFETEKKSNFMPLSLLRGLIQDSGQALKGLAKDGVGAVQQRAMGMAESASKLKSGLEERITQAARQASDVVGDGEDALAKAPMVKDLAVSSKQAFERLQRSVELKIKGPVGNVARFASLGRDMEDIRQRIYGLEDRINSLPQEEAQPRSESAAPVAAGPVDASEATAASGEPSTEA